MSYQRRAPSQRKLSDLARHLVIPQGLETTAWPMIARQLQRMSYPLDRWQVGFGQLLFAKRADGVYGCGVGGAVASIPRQVGKTHMMAGLMFALCIAQPRTLVLWTAHRARTHSETFGSMQGVANRPEIAPFIKTIQRGSGKEAVVFANGSRILFGARENGFGRGFAEVDVEVFDEAQILSEKAMEDMVPATNAAENGLVILLGTPPRPSDPGEVFASRREAALAGDADTLYVEFSADENANPDSRVQWAKANPSYPHRTSETAILRMRKLLGSDDSFRREGLGIWDKTATSKAFRSDAWKVLVSEPPAEGKDVFGVRFSVDGSEVALAAARKPADGGPIFVEAIRSEPVASGTDWLVEFLVARKSTAAQFVIDGKAGVGYLVQALRDAGVKNKLLIITPTTDQVITAHAMFDRGVVEGGLAHSGQEGLTQQVLSASRRSIGKAGGFGWEAPEGGSVTVMEAATLAFWGAKITRRRPGRKQVVSV
ncbi:hypothetical protein [Rothia sp. CCM 9416]|uniref:hypothetical protein n=2 Tax=unclassified Rothia (in: high G+C Gram-positive bacteria) TaxID=2689056 RepID=UPI003ADAEC71